ncbi:hypothetical protein FE236_10520 [Mariprofundus erugo]|uniref:Uncharacterized protein n=1 Tax=Mariprofundus erugo TaxID=2528639 RepID=A0A5R9GQU7_9PROT|nr:hypothetical protein [Mariprofundus erugo]TLS67309.1 hypothetical protein FEF65_07730 [Mariprofundus erugo]TLS74941.1 hypothetical protein FE236_10520 [Mariprofundus erugo]
MMRSTCWLVLALVLACLIRVVPVYASAATVWQQAMEQAAAGHDAEAIARLSGALSMMSASADDLWYERMQVAVMLLKHRRQQLVTMSLADTVSPQWIEVRLMQQYMQLHPLPEKEHTGMITLLATLVPGAGHAWLGRWHDAGVAFMLVVPMLVLTLWAGRRKMGPVTLFFTLITLWLWSGTIFSAISLAERGGAEAYLLWWQGIWQASALPGRPW